MRVLILGGDGYLGWPTAMSLSAQGHHITVVDNYMRRRITAENGCPSLFETPDLEARSRLWEEISGHKVDVVIGNLTDWSVMSEAFNGTEPDAVIHYAEQPSAPYSMLDRDAAKTTLQNNLLVTFNLIHAVHELALDCHIIKLGTMGEYGTPDIDIEEGWIDIEHKGRRDKFLFPRQAGSLYHTTKIMDTDLLWFYVRVWGLRVTDLMQGPVYGIWTPENGADVRLLPVFNYDEIFGTVLNRFITQAVAGHPLTVYGSGKQKRGYLNILDTLGCVRLAMETPAKPGELRIFNQFTETFSVNDLAMKVQSAGNKIGMNVEISMLPNPRIESEDHYYNPARQGLDDLGFEPNLLTDKVLVKMLELVSQHHEKIDSSLFIRNVKWDK